MLKSKQRHDACKVLAQSPEPVRRSGGLRAKNFARKGPAIAGPQPSSLKIDLKALMLLFRTLHKSFFGLEYIRRYCGSKFKQPILRWIQKIPPLFRVKNKTFFHNRKLTSSRVVFRLNKTLFTHFDYNYARIKCLLMTQNRKLLISSSKMRNYIGKKCEQSLYLNPKLSP